MDYEFLIEDLNRTKSQKSIGTDKGLAKIGDGIINLAYSVAKSIFLTKHNLRYKIIRTGSKVSKQVLANALKNANMKDFAKNRADAHDLADTGEALVAYIWLSKYMTLNEIIEVLTNELSGDLSSRSEEIKSAIVAFTNLFNYIRKFLPEI